MSIHFSNNTLLPNTGERMIPEESDPITFWEHIYRYRFATQWVKNKRVLDIACGEGYGAAALSKAGAKSVIGIDVSEETCVYARHKYSIDAQVGRAENIPLPTQSVDLIVSFETIEHLLEQEVFLDECLRLLDNKGKLIISTPNKQIYDKHIDNPFHKRELERDEFISMLATRFSNLALYGQQPVFASDWSPVIFSARHSCWHQIRGTARLFTALRRRLCSHLYSPRLEQYRRSPVEAILHYESPLSLLLNSYAVRTYDLCSKDEMTYLIAIASNK